MPQGFDGSKRHTQPIKNMETALRRLSHVNIPTLQGRIDLSIRSLKRKVAELNDEAAHGDSAARNPSDSSHGTATSDRRTAAAPAAASPGRAPPRAEDAAHCRDACLQGGGSATLAAAASPTDGYVSRKASADPAQPAEPRWGGRWDTGTQSGGCASVHAWVGAPVCKEEEDGAGHAAPLDAPGFGAQLATAGPDRGRCEAAEHFSMAPDSTRVSGGRSADGSDLGDPGSGGLGGPRRGAGVGGGNVSGGGTPVDRRAAGRPSVDLPEWVTNLPECPLSDPGAHGERMSPFDGEGRAREAGADGDSCHPLALIERVRQQAAIGPMDDAAVEAVLGGGPGECPGAADAGKHAQPPGSMARAGGKSGRGSAGRLDGLDGAGGVLGGEARGERGSGRAGAVVAAPAGGAVAARKQVGKAQQGCEGSRSGGSGSGARAGAGSPARGVGAGGGGRHSCGGRGDVKMGRDAADVGRRRGGRWEVGCSSRGGALAERAAGGVTHGGPTGARVAGRPAPEATQGALAGTGDSDDDCLVVAEDIQPRSRNTDLHLGNVLARTAGKRSTRRR